jgi:hypothetical protein
MPVKIHSLVNKETYSDYCRYVDEENRLNRKDIKFLKREKRIGDNIRSNRDAFIYLNDVYTQVIGDFLLNYDGGVYIEGAFYLFFYMSDEKIPYITYRNKTPRKSVNSNINPYIFNVSMLVSSEVFFWRVKKHSLAPALRDKFISNLRVGARYKSYYYNMGKFLKSKISNTNKRYLAKISKNKKK